MALNASPPNSILRCFIRALRRPVSDLARAVNFYVHGLGFEVELPSLASRAVLRLGRERIELVEEVAMCGSRPPANGPDVRFQHAAIVVADMAAAYHRLLHLSPGSITCNGPQQLPAAAGAVVAFKFRDPDGHPLELIGFPPGIGDARWQDNGKICPTLGIDHFALSVSAVDDSIAFYERTFGFTVSSRQLNSGPEQDRLDGLDASVVDIVALRPGRIETPHIELLGYRRPPAYPPDRHAVVEPSDCLLFSCLASCSGRNDNVQDTTHNKTRVRGMDPDGHAFDCHLVEFPDAF